VVALAVRGWLPAPLDQLLCAAAVLFWLGTGRGPQREQHEALLVAFAVRGLIAIGALAGCCAQWAYRFGSA
jgi:hypothetical protein